MEYIDLHAHMVSRTTDDYRAMAMSGCVAVTEPAFWAGYDRPGVDAFIDYFNRLVDFEPKRAATYGIAHFTWMCLNPKEAEDRELTRQVLEVIPRFLEIAERARHRRDRAQPRDHATSSRASRTTSTWRWSTSSSSTSTRRTSRTSGRARR